MYVTLHTSVTVLRNRSLSDRYLMFLVIDHDKLRPPTPRGIFQTKNGMKSSLFCLFSFCNWSGKVATSV